MKLPAAAALAALASALPAPAAAAEAGWAAGGCGSPACAGTGSGSKCPTDDPFATEYGSAAAYPWASAMANWTCVFSVQDYPKGTVGQRILAAAADAAKAPGGGVVFLPEGSYKVSENIVLPSNVVIRGEPTTARAKEGTKPGPLAPKTQLQCPDRMHLGFFNADKAAANISLIHLNLDGCAIMLWPELDKTGFKGWYTATKVLGMGTNKAVLGVRSTNVNYLDKSTTGN